MAFLAAIPIERVARKPRRHTANEGTIFAFGHALCCSTDFAEWRKTGRLACRASERAKGAHYRLAARVTKSPGTHTLSERWVARAADVATAAEKDERTIMGRVAPSGSFVCVRHCERAVRASAASLPPRFVPVSRWDEKMRHPAR